MQDDTRAHERPAQEAAPPGKRVTLTPEQTLLLPAANNTRLLPRLVIHFHGPAWIAESAARKQYPEAGVLCVQARGTASDAYRELLVPVPAERFPGMLEEAKQAAGVARFREVILTSFSAGYGAVREVLRERSNWPLIDAVVLADSMHADYGGELRDLGPFLDFAREMAASGAFAAGKKRFLVTHSEVYPGTYASTTEAASFLLRELQLKRQPVLAWGPLGMQQLSRAGRGGFQVLGFAGNSAPDHLDHLFALEEWLRRLNPPPQPSRPPASAVTHVPGRKKQ